MNNKQIIRIGIIAVFLFSLFAGILPFTQIEVAQASPDPTWWNTSWGKKAPIQINNTGNSDSLRHHHVSYNITYTSDMQSDFDDIRVINDTSGTTVPFWIESKLDSNWCIIWFNVTYIPASSWLNDTYYMYYGNTEVTTTSDGDTTFPFFDDFPIDDFQVTYDANNPRLSGVETWETTTQAHVTEPSLLMDGSTCDLWYRGGWGEPNQKIGYANATDANCTNWNKYAGNPIISVTGHGWEFPYVIMYDGIYYMFAYNVTTKNMYLYNSTDKITWDIMNNGDPIYIHSDSTSDWDYKIFNPAVAIVDGTWHMLLEGANSTGEFHVGYAYSNLSELNWTAHKSSSHVIVTAGNPYLKYVPDRNALFTVHGDDSTGTWKLIAHYASLSDDLSLSSSWHTCPNFGISESGVHLADPHLVFTDFTKNWNIIIQYNRNQENIYQAYSNLSLNEFYDTISSEAFPQSKWTGDTDRGSVSDGILTFTGNGTQKYLYSTTSHTPNMALRLRAKLESDSCQIGFQNSAPLNGRSFIYGRKYGITGDGGVTEWSAADLWNYDTWYTFDIQQISGTSVEFLKDGSSDATLTTQVGTIAQTVELDSYDSSNEVFVDLILVHNYTSPEPTTLLGAEESPPYNYIYTGANEWILFNNWSSASETFEQIAANESNDIAYSHYNSTSGEWESYWVGYNFNKDIVIDKHESMLGFFDAGTTITCSVPSAESISIPATAWYYTYLRESTSHTLSEIKTSMVADGCDIWEIYAFDNSTQNYNSSTSYNVDPNEGCCVYANSSCTWDGGV